MMPKLYMIANIGVKTVEMQREPRSLHTVPLLRMVVGAVNAKHPTS